MCEIEVELLAYSIEDSEAIVAWDGRAYVINLAALNTQEYLPGMYCIRIEELKTENMLPSSKG